MLSLLLFASIAFADPISDYAGRRLQCWSSTAYESTTIDDSGSISTRGSHRVIWGQPVGFSTSAGSPEFDSAKG
jgi:hypothetical protein